MRNRGLVSAAVIAMSMAAMAGAVAASAPPVMQSQSQRSAEHRIQALVDQAEEQILGIVSQVERDGVSGEAAQQRITGYLQDYLWQGFEHNEIRPASETEKYIVLERARRSLINSNRLRRGSDGDLAISALVAAREAESRAERNMEGRNRLGGPLRGGGGPRWPPQAPVAVQGSPTVGDAGRNVPGNEAAGQAATNAGTTEIQQTQTTNDPDLDDEAGEPD